MGRLRAEKLHVTFAPGTQPERPIVPRAYTLTHSDRTGDLYLTIGLEHDRKQISGLYTRLMRDEVLADWREDEDGFVLHVHCHVSGGLTVGSAKMRLAIFRHELPLVLEAFRYGDRHLFDAHPHLDQAAVLVHFRARQRRYDTVERWGPPADYRHQG
ncbi:MAG: staygreen family protein [Anaerolineae bacterium]